MYLCVLLYFNSGDIVLCTYYKILKHLYYQSVCESVVLDKLFCKRVVVITKEISTTVIRIFKNSIILVAACLDSNCLVIMKIYNSARNQFVKISFLQTGTWLGLRRCGRTKIHHLL